MATGLGIDIGSESIKVVQVRVSANSVTVTGALKIPRNAEAILDAPIDEMKNQLVPETFGQELKRAHLRRSGTVGISGRDVILKYLTTPPMPPPKLKMYIDMEIGEKLTLKGTAPALTYDYRLLNIPSGLKGDLVIMAGVCKNEYLFGMNAMLKRAGVGASRITPSCFGLVNAYLRTQKIPSNETVVLVDIGHELLEIAILEESHLYFARCAPGGGKKFTSSLDKVLHVGAAKAAEFKHNRARMHPEGTQLSNQQEQSFQPALKEGADAIAGAIRSSVMFCRTQARLSKLDYQRVFISGGGARLNGLREYLEKKVGRPVQILDLYSGLDLRKLDAASARCFEGDVPDMAVALGLAIIDAVPGSFHFSLLPEKLVKKQIFWNKTAFGIAAAVVMAVGLIPPFQNSREAARASGERTEFYKTKDEEARDQRNKFAKRLETNRVLTEQVDYYARQTRMGRVYLDMFMRIRAELPPDFTLTYVGPVSDSTSGPVSWNIHENAIRDFMIRGFYETEAYPGAKFNDAWEAMREKLLKVPGISDAGVDLVSGPDAVAKPGMKAFQMKIHLRDASKPVR